MVGVGATISVTQWQRATEALHERTKEQPKKRWIRHFRYDLQAGKISSWHAKEASALFFEYEICSGVDINNNYILLEISDGADDADGVKLYQSFKYQNDPERERILRTGVAIAGEERNLYSLMGASNSGVQTHSYVFRRGSLAENERLMLQLMPNLQQLELSKGVAKRIKYQGLLFSGAQVVDLPQDDGPVHVLEIPSVERKRPYSNGTYDFTDGCGLISIKLAKYLHKKVLGLGMSKGHSSGVPSVFHIRYAGQIRKLTGDVGGDICKGVFLVDYRNESTYEICFRKSMLKETVSPQCANVLGRKIGIIGWSKESPGRLSQQLVCLLSASVPHQVLEDMQNQQHEAVEEAVTDPMSAAWLAALEPKPATWYAFQGLLLGAAREDQSCMPDASIQGSAPSSYFACTNGRRHPRHLSDNLTKVQVPLSSARTLFGVAFPETLSKVIREGECIVMLEDGPLEDKVVIVSRSPSYHPGDVRVLHNRASELPDNHPVVKLTNCIIFATDGTRPDADKMGGGDLDGDRFLIVWDHRLIKYRNKIQAYEAQDYDVDTSGNERKRVMVVPSDNQKNNSDWIHAVAMLDSVMLGAIENSYYALAKEFGVVSTEINELNKLFSQLVSLDMISLSPSLEALLTTPGLTKIDRKPAALESFETLCKKAYNPQHAKKSLIGPINNSMSEGDALWDVMLLRQKELLAKMRCTSSASHDEYIIFYANLQKLCDVSYLEHRLSTIQFHFGASFHKKRISRTFEQFRELAIASKEPTNITSFSAVNDSKVCVTYSQFVNKMDAILLESEAKLSKTFELIRSQQQKLLEFIQRQKQLHTSIVRRFESGEIESVDDEVEACRKICDELYTKVDDAKHNVSSYNKLLLEKKVAMEKCSGNLYELQARSSELPLIVEENEATIKSLRSFKKEVTQYASDIGVPNFSYSGSFLGMEKYELLSSTSSLSINICVMEFSTSLDKAKECLTESLEEIQSIPLISMISEEHQHIQKLQHNYLSANSIHLVAQTYLPIIENFLKDLSMPKEHHDIVGDLIVKCQAVIDLTKSALIKSTSSFKNCLLHSDAIYLAECAGQTGLGAIADSIEKELGEIAKAESDASRFKEYYRWFRKFIAEIPLKEKRALLETRKAKNDLQRIESLSMEQSKLENEVKVLEELKIVAESDIDDMTKVLDTTFSPSIFEQTEKDYAQENSYIDSIQLSIGHIRHEYNKYITKWGSQKGPHNDLLDTMEDGMKRICSIEVNRCIGKYGEPLPVYKKRAELNRLISANDVVIVTAQTGSGKSTQVPQYLADDQYTWISGSNNEDSDEAKSRGFRLCCTQPRRIAARSIAERVAKEYQTRLGMKVGFRVGRRDGVEITDSKQISDCTEIEYVTEGLLLAQLRGSPNRIKNYDVVIIDEAHERNIETDLLLSFLRNHLRRLKTNPQPGDIPLKVIVMSASIDFERFCEYFDGCPRMDCPGKIYDVEEHYKPAEEDACLDDDYSMSTTQSYSNLDDEFIPNSISKPFTSIADVEKTLVEHATSVLFEDIVCPEKEEGDVLIFFSGSREIWECVDAINARARSESRAVVSYPLYSSMDEESKYAAKDPAHRIGLDGENTVQPRGYVRKVICCTNIAETSLTIDGVRFVIDTGKAKKMRYSHLLRTMTLREEDVAQSSTKQRKGRAGRTQTGWVYYLFSKQAHDQMEEYELPKILQTPVEQLILYSMYNCECPIESLGLLDSPCHKNIEMAKGRLEDLGFVTYADDERTLLRLTSDGQLSAILSSLKPEAVRMILWANTNAPIHRKKVIKMAALLSIEDDIFIGPSKLRIEPISTKGFTKTRSRTSIQLVRDEAEVYAYEEDQKQHQLGDHFLLLREFECFENERMKCLKTSNSKLRLWCKKRGLNYAALNQAQLLAEQCHNELKKRKVLVDQREVLQNAIGGETNEVCRWTSDEVIIRAMLTGYFHQIVQSSDPLLKRKQSDFTILSPHDDLCFNVRLDRDSCLWKIAKSTQKTETVLDFIPDDDNEEMQTTDIAIEKQVKFSLLLFTRLRTIVVRSNLHELVFMEGATAVDVNWLCEQAPESWLERVNVDELKSNMMCGLIRNIGPRILVALMPFLNELKNKTAAKDINIDKDTGQIIVYGSQAVVLGAKDEIMTKVESIRSYFYAEDVKSVSTSIGMFGSGLELQILSENKLRDQYKGWLLKEIPKRLLSINCREPLSIKTPNPVSDQLEVYIKNTWDVKLFTIMFNEISDAFNADNSGKCSLLIISPTRGVKFIFKFVMNGVDLAIQNAVKGSNGSKAKRKRKRGDKVRTKNSNGSDQIQLNGYIQDIKMRIGKAVQNEMKLLSVGGFPTEKLPLVRALIREFQFQTQFWIRSFPMVKFSPSHGHFEMFQLSPQELQARIATLDTTRNVIQLDAAARPKEVEESCEKVSDDEVESELHEVEHFTRSELCRFSAIIEGFRKSHPNVLWVVNYTIDTTVNKEKRGKQTSGDQSSSELLSCENDEHDEMVLDQSEDFANSMTENLVNKDKQDDHEGFHDNENPTAHESSASNETTAKAEVGTIGLLAPSYWLKSDYERLLAVHENRFLDGAVTGLSIAIHSFSKTQPMKAISDCRQQLKSFFLDTSQLILPDRVENGTRQKICVMCRRVVEIRFRGTSDGSKLQGHQLTICGCAYCRECFRASAEQSVDDCEAVQCRNCKRQVLAGADCQQILGTNYRYKNDPLFHIHQNEWIRLLRKAEKKYCAEILVGGGEYSNIHTCTDCGGHSVFNTSKPFFRCSESNCPNIFCNTCLQVASSLSAEQQKMCANGKCKN